MMGEARARIIRWVAVATGVTLAWLEWQASPNADSTVLALDVAVGLTFFGAAFITLGVPTARRIAYLELAAGTAWFVGALVPVASGAYLGFLAHLLVSYPIGRLERPAQRGVVAAGYILALVAPQLGLVGVETALLAIVAVTLLVRASATDGPLRRGRMGAALVAGTMAVAFAVVAAGLAAGTLDFAVSRMLSSIVLILGTVVLTIDLRWGGWSRDALTRLVIDLGDRAEGTTLRDRLAAALDDPSLVIGYAIDEAGAYVDDDGRPVELPPPGSGRVAVPLRLAGGIEVGCSCGTSDGPSIRSWPMALPRPPSLPWAMPGSTRRPGARWRTSRRHENASSPPLNPSASGSVASSTMEPYDGSSGCVMR